MKILLLDADGVVLKKDEYFSERYAREHNVPIEDMVEFFRGPFGECQAGTKDLKAEIIPYLEKWGWEGTVDTFLDYWFEDVQIDPTIKEVINVCKEKGISCYLASNNEYYRARKIEEDLGDMLDGYFFSADLKVKKEDPRYFRLVKEKTGVPFDEIAFVDNDDKNIEAAKELGIEARLVSDGVWNELLGIEFNKGFKLI